MKKIFSTCVLFISLLSARLAFAAWGDETLINSSSFTASNDTTLAISSLTMAGGVFVGVVVSSSTGGGTVTFYDSVGTTNNKIGFVSMANTGSGAFYIPYEVRLSSGLTYTTAGNSNGITIIYKNLRAR